VRNAIVAVGGLLALSNVGLADDKEHKLAVAFGTPNPSWKATITGGKVVGKELWVRVDVASAGGVAIQVIGKAKAELTVKAPDLPVKYLVFGKTWGWKNEEKDIVFLHDLPEKERKGLEKQYEDGKVAFEVKPKREK
jgi:hypothetical protein